MNKSIAHEAFEHLRSEHVASLDIDVHEFRHNGTGTPHVHIAADNPENVFLVGLRTVPQDSTGVAHILEHTVLCGSERYPVRDPFFMMIRRSLNTFMNAFTSSDWTAYPFASQNRKDYFNLLDVYLDAVFFSNLHELDFAQEGHRVEFEKADDPTTDLVFKGVVFNEMKGAMSAPTSILWQTLGKHLFPNNTYHYNSGGDPEVIPDLTHEQLVEFYRTHYHPSNAVFMTYGDIAPAELQARFDERVLTRFEPLGRKVSVKPALRYHSPIRVEEAYATQEEDTEERTHVVVGWLLDESSDLDARLRAHLLSSVLLDNSASPLMRALEQSELGSSPSPLCGLDDGNREMVFVCGMEGTRTENDAKVETMIIETLERVASEGVPVDQVEAMLHQLELGQREIRGDGMPFGLQLVLSGLSTAMQRGDTLAAIDMDPALERLRAEAGKPDFVQRAVRELLLENPHRVTLTLRADNRISSRRNLAEKRRLEKMKAALDSDERRAIVERAEALAARQAQEDDPEILPKVTLADVPETMRIPEGRSAEIHGAPAALYAQGTNGLVYQHVAVELPELDDEHERMLSPYSGFLAELGSGGRDYLDTQSHQAAISGGVSAYTLRRGSIDDAQAVTGHLVLRGKALLRNSGELARLLDETLTSVRFDELPRLRELVAQTRASYEQRVTGAGHMLAMTAAASGMNPTMRLAHRTTGLAGIHELKSLDERMGEGSTLADFAASLSRVGEALADAPRRYLAIAEEENVETVLEDMARAFSAGDGGTSFSPFAPKPVRERVGELWTTSTEVNFCARAYPTVSSSHEDAAALAVLGPFLRNGFLHRAIRETGGAYGGGASHDADSASFRFYSYRDPRLVETLADFDRSVEWLCGESHDERELEEAILSIVGSIDKPGSPAGEARNAWQAELFGRTAEKRRAFRKRILGVTMADLVRVGETWLAPDKASTAVITSETTAREGAVEALGLERREL